MALQDQADKCTLISYQSLFRECLSAVHNPPPQNWSLYSTNRILTNKMTRQSVLSLLLNPINIVSLLLHSHWLNPSALRSCNLPHWAERYNYFSQHVIPVWNSLPASIVTSNSASLFKLQLDLTSLCKPSPFK